MDELKACPFCGGKAYVSYWVGTEPGEWVSCDYCGRSYIWTGGGGLNLWNTRPLEDALRAELAKRKPIPVSERMPEYIEGKLNYVMLFDSIGGEWEIGRFVKLSNSRYQWSLETGIYWHDGDFARVTHWMPLPEPPEVNDGQA